MTDTEVSYLTDKKFQFQMKFDYSFITTYYYLNWSLFVVILCEGIELNFTVAL